jgi:hypothetical protein
VVGLGLWAPLLWSRAEPIHDACSQRDRRREIRLGQDGNHLARILSATWGSLNGVHTLSLMQPLGLTSPVDASQVKA